MGVAPLRALSATSRRGARLACQTTSVDHARRGGRLVRHGNALPAVDCQSLALQMAAPGVAVDSGSRLNDATGVNDRAYGWLVA
jgi:hypothetical protein